MTMAKANANGIQIEYETFGNASGRPLLLIIGLGGQLNQWDDGLCRDLAERGHYVIRFDNRDAGLSTKFEEAGVPNLMEIFGKLMQARRSSRHTQWKIWPTTQLASWTPLESGRPHLWYVHGGMIAQTIAIQHPSRILSLISIYSTTGNRKFLNRSRK